MTSTITAFTARTAPCGSMQSGEVVVTESNAHVIRGHFTLIGQGVEPVGRKYPEVTVKGEFTAECDLEPRAAYTCD